MECNTWNLKKQLQHIESNDKPLQQGYRLDIYNCLTANYFFTVFVTNKMSFECIFVSQTWCYVNVIVHSFMYSSSLTAWGLRDSPCPAHHRAHCILSILIQIKGNIFTLNTFNRLTKYCEEYCVKSCDSMLSCQ